MTTFVAGISFKTAPVELREQLAVPPARLDCRTCWLRVKAGLSEAVLLSTCNRVELYGVTDQPHRLESVLNNISDGTHDVSDYVYVRQDESAIRHLFAVASGLDSMVLGETEITGQVKNAYQHAQQMGVTGRTTNRLFQKAFRVAKEVRTNTEIGHRATSVGSAAVQLVEKIFDADLSNKTVMIIGAGKMGEACVRHLSKRGAKSVIVSNRSVDRARVLAGEFGGQAIQLEQTKDAMVGADIVVSSTGSPQLILTRGDVEEVMHKRRNRPLFLIDIAVPRDIDPAIHGLENVYLYNIDDLQQIIAENVRLREQALASCQTIIDEHTAELMSKTDPVPNKTYEQPIQPQHDWALGGAAA